MEECEERLDEVFINAFETNHPAMLDWVAIKFKLRELDRLKQENEQLKLDIDVCKNALRSEYDTIVKNDQLKQDNEKLKTAIELIRSLPLMNGIQFEDIENQYRETIDRIKTAITRDYLP